MNLTSAGDEEEAFASTLAGVVIPSLTGSLSFISSTFIMITILRSRQNTQYHRILFCLSFWDAIVSFCISLSTLPMPSDVVYDYKGPSYGTTRTCEFQAFLIFLGWGYVCNSNALLNIYYLCSIRYNVTEETFRKVAEPVFAITSSALSLASPIYFLSRDAFNPTPVDTFCAVDVYPRSCLDDPSIECIHGKAEDWDETLTFYYFYPIAGIGTNFIILILSMILVVYTVCNPQEELARGISQKQKRIIAIQACMYILACFLAWVFTVVSIFVDESKTVATLKYIFTPLQGFFNLFIFIFQKLYTCTNSQKGGDLTLHETLKLCILSPSLMVDKTLVLNIDFLANFRGKKITKLSADEVKRNLRKRKNPLAMENSVTDSKEQLYDDLEAMQHSPLQIRKDDIDNRDQDECKVESIQSLNTGSSYYNYPIEQDQEYLEAADEMQGEVAKTCCREQSITSNEFPKGLTTLRCESKVTYYNSPTDLYSKERNRTEQEDLVPNENISRYCDHIMSSTGSFLSPYLDEKHSSRDLGERENDSNIVEELDDGVDSNASTIVTGVGSYSKQSKASWKSL
ncbi:hypothetical protein CTEN210_14788 [Chaetoceros tenuissimus]|uniref:G-protein coupled receptors family 1 profile domain-containing protein n=1 Tax=Chaetoceros tenuissimus TaxID=426638 RepID=A0AAD3D6D4_9STRA|nr:hypothetical protein CTEN210_14788 [Chaetoceros tenuissimus]